MLIRAQKEAGVFPERMLTSPQQKLWIAGIFFISAFNFWHIASVISYNNRNTQEDEVLVIDNSDFCSSDGSVCVYHDICYDIYDGSWHASADPKHFPLLNDDNFTKPSDSRVLKRSRCNERFTPISSNKRSLTNERDMIYKKGTTYFVCCWTNHFGHILVQLISSAVHALVKVGFEGAIRTDSVNFLVDNRAPDAYGTPETALSTFSFVTGNSQQVWSFQKLLQKAKYEKKSSMCFEQLVVGMRFTDLAYSRFNDTLASEAEVGMLKPLREHLNDLYPSTRSTVASALRETILTSSGSKEFVKDVYSPPECTLTFLQRKGKSRAMSNLDKVMHVTKTIFHESKWNIQKVSFDGGPSLMSQYLTVHNTMLFVSVSGTGSHMAMFLPDGAVSIEIHYNNTVPMVNKGICPIIPTMTCLTSTSGCPSTQGTPIKNCKYHKVTVDLTSFTIAMEDAKERISKNCDDARR